MFGRAMTIRICTLGPFSVERDDAVVADGEWKTQKNKALFKILVTFRGHPLTKEHLMEWLWPDHPPEAADGNLRVAISQLRQALEPDLPCRSQSHFILTTDAGYAWNTLAHLRARYAEGQDWHRRGLDLDWRIGDAYNETHALRRVRAGKSATTKAFCGRSAFYL